MVQQLFKRLDQHVCGQAARFIVDAAKYTASGVMLSSDWCGRSRLKKSK